MPIWDADNLSAPHTQRELDDVPNGEREVPPELAEGMLALKALLTRIVAAEAEIARLTAERDAALAGAFCMGRDAAAAIPADHAEYARKSLGATTHPQYASDWSIIVSRCDMIVDAIRALTPPADLAAKIGGE